jgi:hypothetical protein
MAIYAVNCAENKTRDQIAAEAEDQASGGAPDQSLDARLAIAKATFDRQNEEWEAAQKEAKEKGKADGKAAARPADIRELEPRKVDEP